jgi:tRNA1Val (adenine37-N6)-methyltransferase
LFKTVFYQPSKGYRYNSDTLFLWDFILRRRVSGSVLDIGSGSGVLGILLKREFPKIELNSVEKQEIFQKLTLKNSEINQIDNNLYSGDFLEVDFQKQFDLIVSNPPFYNPAVIQSENQNLNIARYSQHLPIEDFFKKVSKLLKNRGRFIFCYDVKEFVNLGKILEDNRLKIERVRFVHPKEEKNASLILIDSRKDSKTSLSVEPPLINFSDEVNQIYKKANTYTLSF